MTSGVTWPDATSTIEMSALPLLPASLLTRWSNAIRAPSGDQSKLPTTNAPAVSGARGLGRHVQHVQLRHAMVAILVRVLAVLLLAFLHAPP